MRTLRDVKNLTHHLGLSLITGAANDDRSGLATYSQAVAHFGAWFESLVAHVRGGVHQHFDLRAR